ncbi:MAG: hypothetical protein A2846_04465 [Candidatus Doudnabacteria bacterium RIFCSPHIGHO2_01_FULL_49_9]|uniref:Methylated-DNA-[protein]-cysteine S-methyltransferase DNA binding domain-containing protein n=1 Tax=Candidatus Doudnabacteria bacterium RIFCSPHIGHO2_01_FULL_49_9 TaxID=1817827 RepID=A0A1F5P1F2_9BACT|nr:MAG: hypothetical protein A2846_04465 [Candidatus Doudnabacteria bacterium RIFCSPHIGHO2_01_FULL_49_9]
MTIFSEKVLEVARNVQRGKTMTYKEVAARAGNSKAARAVGAIMASNKDLCIPCHRVIRSDGKIGGYNGLLGEKRMRLREEGALQP